MRILKCIRFFFPKRIAWKVNPDVSAASQASVADSLIETAFPVSSSVDSVGGSIKMHLFFLPEKDYLEG